MLVVCSDGNPVSEGMPLELRLQLAGVIVGGGVMAVLWEWGVVLRVLAKH